MIENIVLKALKADGELAELTGGKIYPNVAQTEALPVVIMTSDEPTNPTNDPFYYTQNLTFEIYAKTERSAQDIRNRLYTILNRFDNYFQNDLAKTGIIIREAHAVYASVSNHFHIENEQARERAVSFDFKYTKCA